MSSDQPNLRDIRRVFDLELHQHWALYLVEGVVLLVLGATAIVLPPLATLAATILIGWLVLVSGVVGFFTTFMQNDGPGFGWSLLSAVLAIIVGAVLLGNAELAAVSLTIVLLVFFIIEGGSTLMYARAHRRQMSQSRWGWIVASGIVDLALAAYILSGLPVIAPWALGLMVGVNMVFGGVAMIALAERAHAADKARAARPDAH
jgi:uncharacterized membrane protein HdeD (DUF308 family)